jgi:hypothetical protein
MKLVAATWSQRVREGGPAAVIRSARLAGSAVAAYAAALSVVDDRRPVTAALTALLIVQVTLVGTLAETWRRVVSVLLGVGVAITVSTFVGLTWWSLGALVAGSILLGQTLRLGAHLLEVPISAMLILAAGGAGAQAGDRVVETVLGAAFGVLVNVLIPPRPRTGSAAEAVERYAQRIARLLNEVADALAEVPVTREEARTWLGQLRIVTGDTVQVDRELTEAQESRRLNPRAVGTWDPVPDLRGGLDALEHAAVALRSVFRSIADGAIESADAEDDDGSHEDDASNEGEQVGAGVDDAASRKAVAAALHDFARSVAAFGALLRAGSDDTSRAAELAQALAAVREARGRIADRLAVIHGPTFRSGRIVARFSPACSACWLSWTSRSWAGAGSGSDRTPRQRCAHRHRPPSDCGPPADAWSETPPAAAPGPDDGELPWHPSASGPVSARITRRSGARSHRGAPRTARRSLLRPRVSRRTTTPVGSASDAATGDVETIVSSPLPSRGSIAVPRCARALPRRRASRVGPRRSA